jgi:methionyl aminopeptidase
MRKSCAMARDVLKFAGQLVQAGTTTEAIDAACHDFIVRSGAYPSPLEYHGCDSHYFGVIMRRFPKSICTSVNNIAVHGIPDTYASLIRG